MLWQGYGIWRPDAENRQDSLLYTWYVNDMQIKDTDWQLLQWYLFEYSKLRIDTKLVLYE